MSTVTPKLGLVKPVAVEQFSLATYNNNLDLVDEFAVANEIRIDEAAGAYNINTVNGTQSLFTRIRFGPTAGIIFAKFSISFGATTIAIPASTAAPVVLPGFVPAGYRGPNPNPASIPLYALGTIVNAGSGASVHLGHKDNGDVIIRAFSTTFNTVSGTQLCWSTTYKWDGVL